MATESERSVNETDKNDDPGAQNRALTDDEKVDVGSEDSMDASDPSAVVHPGDNGDPVPSSGFDEAKERSRNPA